MKKYKVEVIKDLFPEKIKGKDIDTLLANNLELYLNQYYNSGWNFVGLETLTIEVKTSFLGKKQQVKKNVAIFTKTEKYASKENSEKIIQPNIPLGPALKKM